MEVKTGSAVYMIWLGRNSTDQCNERLDRTIDGGTFYRYNTGKEPSPISLPTIFDLFMQTMTPEIKRTILQLKYDTPDEEKIAGIEYYQAVIRGGVNDYEEFVRWRKSNPLDGVLQWTP